MSAFFWAWLITLALGWFIIDEQWRLYRARGDNLNAALDWWRRTIDELEAAQRRIAELETQRSVIPGDEWKN